VCKVLICDRDQIFYHQILLPVLPFFLKKYCNRCLSCTASITYTPYYPDEKPDTLIINWDDWKGYTEVDNLIRIGYDSDRNAPIINKKEIFSLFFEKLKERQINANIE
jgi:hypothetical protein